VTAPPPGLPVYRPQDVDAHPPLDWPDYASTKLRHPLTAPLDLPQRLTEVTGPLLGEVRVDPGDADLTRQHDGEPVGQRIVVHGRVLDDDGRPLAGTLLEIWQANAGGRYRHTRDNWPSPLDPNFSGVGRTVTDEAGRYSFTTIRPGAYPWRNHHNAWRPAHIHFSLLGRAFTQRLVTQMYFPDDPLFFQDPIMNAVPASARPRMVCAYDHETTVPEWALGFRWDIVLRGTDATPLESDLTGAAALTGDDEDEA
jgi:protocatechuate 3,4-dioxygenase beta subunit